MEPAVTSGDQGAVLQQMAELMAQMQGALGQPSNDDLSKEMRLSPADMRRRRVLNEVFKAYELVYVESARAVYYRPQPDNITPDQAFKRLTDIRASQLVVGVAQKLYPHMVLAPKTVEEYSRMLSHYTSHHVDIVNDNLIKIGADMYWDEEDARVTSIADGACMRELFDASPLDEIKLDINDMSTSYLKGVYKRTVEHLEKNNGDIVPWELLSPKEQQERGCELLSLKSASLAPFWVWANESLDTLNDLLKAVASIFMYNKPKGAFILIGRTRNGKSSFIKMLHTMLGRNNTSAVKLADLEDPHFVYDLTTTMLNAPDEDDEGKGAELKRSQSYFKSISAHEPIPLKLLFSAEPVKVSTQFMSFYPMNKLPEWSGSGKEACMRRSLILMFNNDLSRFDNNGRNFEKETYTVDFYAELLGVVLAIAHYYRTRRLEFSSTMEENRESVSEAIDSPTTYLNLFRKYFDAYQVSSIVNDYELWCVENGLQYNRKELKQKLLTANGKKSSVYYDGGVTTVQVFPDAPSNQNERKPSFFDGLMVPEFKRYVSDITNTNTVGVGPNKQPARSVVAMLEEYYMTHTEKPAAESEQMAFDGAISDGNISDDGELEIDL